MMRRRFPVRNPFVMAGFLACACLVCGAYASDELLTLTNGQFSVTFGAHGVVSLADVSSKTTLRMERESAEMVVDGQSLRVPGLKFVERRKGEHGVTYCYEAGARSLQVCYELRPGWHFVSKRLVLVLAAGEACRIEKVHVTNAVLGSSVLHEHRASRASGGVFLRFGSGAGPAGAGAFFALQNPFLDWDRRGEDVSVAYAADMSWNAADGPFESDRVCIGLHALTGREMPARGLAEWKYVPAPEKAFEPMPQLDLAETEALTRCVEAFQLYRPDRSLRVHVPWCENDYQIDVGTIEGRTEYKRIIDQVSAVGCDNMLFTPGNSEVSSLAENADAWGWENVLWLGLGQKIRQGQWDIDADPLPASVQELLDYARRKNVRFVAYVYPTLAWTQDPAWTAWCGGKTGGYVGVDTGVRGFQDWFVDRLVAFHRRTGISGFSFDHWWIAYEAKDGLTPTSNYAQWYGCRRILEELRRRIPDVVIDGRQQYQWFGPWTWLGGSYPHPTMNDEQPGSFENFPDLHFSRVSGDRQRWAAWWYRNEQFTPLDLVPGYMTHQTPRNDAEGRCVRDRAFFTRDWDLLGWHYSVLSSVATAPFNHVVDYLPARDETEFAHFAAEDQRWLREWMDWSDQHRGLLRTLRPIIGPPALGRIDGTAAVEEDHGFLFLFNPNYRELAAEFTLDASIGLTAGDQFVLRELHPRKGRLLGKPGSGTWRRGDRVSLPIKGPQALALELVPASRLALPVLLNAEGEAVLQGSTLLIKNARGECGTTGDLTVLLPPGQPVDAVTINGHKVQTRQLNDRALAIRVAFDGDAFAHCQQVGAYDPHFTGDTVRAAFTIPRRVFDQLAQRRRSWPIPYTEEELLATWRAPHRLLLYVHIAEPDDTWTVGLTIDGGPVELKRAYSDVYPLGRERTFTGFYTDVSHLQPGKRYEVELALPANLQPGQFQGLFFENVEAEFTGELADTK
ncbi:MAG: hypothetical protein FJ276_02635 [Planctomycetes bacterium]|nr:hypothetical protein [Planctomycetota bacterium]